ncbi:MAG: hypothetical protein JKX83_08375 [Pseudomonadales bacterium]|nr:hypothetical protein [Pseudomonadales bacterium]
MSELTIEIKAIGPENKPYLSLAKGLEKQYKKKKIELSAPEVKTDSQWNSVLLTVSLGITPKLISNLIDLITTIAQDNEEVEIDLSIHVVDADVFYDLPDEKDLFLSGYKKKKAKKTVEPATEVEAPKQAVS